jgi:hypothetical protein
MLTLFPVQIETDPAGAVVKAGVETHDKAKTLEFAAQPLNVAETE